MSATVIVEPDRVEQQIRNLASLRTAAERCGAVFNQGQTTIRGLYNDNVKKRCRHVIAAGASEVGVLESQKYSGTYCFAHDSDYNGEIDRMLGKQFSRLQMFYQMAEARTLAESQGRFYSETQVAPDRYEVLLTSSC